MKSFPVILVVLASVLNSTALITSPIRLRQDDGSDPSTLCAGTPPTLISTSTFTVSDNTTVELAKFACPVSPFVNAHRGEGLLGLLGGLLGWLFPFPPFPPRPKTTTVTEATTATATATVTAVSVSVSVSATTATATATEVTTATATEVATATETIATTDTATVTVSVPATTPTSSATNVCGELCTTVCAQSGSLPPVSEDCQALVNSITILNGQIPPDFTVESNHVQTISFGTCRFFFENVGPDPLTSCWLSLSQVASAAASACLPPNQPVLSEGLCIPKSGLWEIGVAHS